MKGFTLIFVIFLIESTIGQESEEMFMCRKAGQTSISKSSLLHEGTNDVNLGQSPNSGNKAPSKDQIIQILEERLRVLECKSLLIFSIPKYMLLYIHPHCIKMRNDRNSKPLMLVDIEWSQHILVINCNSFSFSTTYIVILACPVHLR